MSKSLELRLLRRIPKKYLESRAYWGHELEELSAVYRRTEWNDPYHASIRTLSHYTSMEDMKVWILSQRPDADLSTWSMRQTHGGGAEATLKDGTIVSVSPDVMESLATDHEGLYTYAYIEGSWSIDLDYDDAEWLEAEGLGYVSERMLKRLLTARIREARLTACPEDRLQERASWGGGCDIFGILCDAHALARRKRMAVYAYLSD